MSKRRRGKGAGQPKQIQPMTRHLIDVILPLYGEWAMAEAAIGSIDAAMFGVEEGYRVIVVDNGTPDWQDHDGNIIKPTDQAKRIRELLRPQDAFYRLEQNQGYPGAINYALSKSNANLVLIWTADVVMTPGSIKEMLRVMDDPDVAIVGCKLIFPTAESPHGPPGMIQHAGIAFNIEGKPFHILMGWPPDHPKVNIEQEVMAVTGALLLVRRSLFDATRGFATIYGAGTFEDMDLCFSAREAGKKVMYCPTAWGTHYVGGSWKKGAGQTGFNLQMNSQVFRGRWAHRLQWDEYKYW